VLDIDAMAIWLSPFVGVVVQRRHKMPDTLWRPRLHEKRRRKIGKLGDRRVGLISHPL